MNKNVRVLFVDDDSELREIVRRQLEQEGFSVDDAADGDSAQEKLLREPYDLVLLDIKMPGKSGLDILHLVRDRPLKCKVIMLTGVMGLATAIESLSLGASDYITKPYTLEQVLSSIARVLKTDVEENKTRR